MLALPHRLAVLQRRHVPLQRHAVFDPLLSREEGIEDPNGFYSLTVGDIPGGVRDARNRISNVRPSPGTDRRITPHAGVAAR